MSNHKNKIGVKNSQLPPIPEKLYFTIGEVGKLCDLKPHVLRYWEQEFQQLAPSKRRGNRRYYQRKDVALIREIRALLYEQGYTIDGARARLMEPKQASSAESTPSSLSNIIQHLESALSDIQS